MKMETQQKGVGLINSKENVEVNIIEDINDNNNSVALATEIHRQSASINSGSNNYPIQNNSKLTPSYTVDSSGVVSFI